MALDQQYQLAVNEVMEQNSWDKPQAEQYLKPYLDGYKAKQGAAQYATEVDQRSEYAMKLAEYHKLDFKDVRALTKFKPDKTMADEAARLAQTNVILKENIEMKQRLGDSQPFDSGQGGGGGYSNAEQVRDARIANRIDDDEFDTEMAKFS